MWTTADPVVREWIERNLGPVGKIEGAIAGAGEIWPRLSSGRCRQLLDRARSSLISQLDAITRDGLVLAPETVAADRPGRGARQPLGRRWRCG